MIWCSTHTHTNSRKRFGSMETSHFVLHLLRHRFFSLMAEQINHPILITECACNPVQSRSKMAELLFETYGVPSIGMIASRSMSSCCSQNIFVKYCTCSILSLLYHILINVCSQLLVLMLLSAISTINNLEFVTEMVLQFAQDLPQAM